jgi:hypothetical protein
MAVDLPGHGFDAPLPDLVLSFDARDRSPALNAFLDVIRANCPDVGAALDHRLGPSVPGHPRVRP